MYATLHRPSDLGCSAEPCPRVILNLYPFQVCDHRAKSVGCQLSQRSHRPDPCSPHLWLLTSRIGTPFALFQLLVFLPQEPFVHARTQRRFEDRDRQRAFALLDGPIGSCGACLMALLLAGTSTTSARRPPPCEGGCPRALSESTLRVRLGQDRLSRVLASGARCEHARHPRSCTRLCQQQICNVHTRGTLMQPPATVRDDHLPRTEEVPL